MKIGEVLGEKGISICNSLAKSSLSKHFYLAGGTGLALQLGHRKSLDLDFFQINERNPFQFERVSSGEGS